MSDWMKKIEETFYNYTSKYDKNIKELVKKRGIEISNEELEEILHDAKNLVTE